MKSSREIVSELSLLVVGAFVTRLTWVFMVPMKEAPDEYCHFWVCNFLSQNARLPLAAEVHAGGIEAVYGSLPQLGYLPHVLASRLLPGCDSALAFRFGSLAMGLLAVAAAYFLARQLFSESKIARLALPLLMIFHPQLVLVHAYTNTDSTVSALGALVLLLAVLTIKRGLSLGKSAVLGFLLGWLALSKYSAYSLFFGAGLALLLAACLHGASLATLALNAAAVFACCALACGWWFFREIKEYPGDLLGTETMYRTWAQQFNKPLQFKENIWHIIKDLPRWRMTFDSYWGVFGYMQRYLWRPLYTLYFAFAMLATIGGAFKLFDLKAGYRLVLDKLKGQTGAGQIQDPGGQNKLEYAAILSTFAVCVAVNLAAMVWSASKNLGSAQGRYLFGCEVPILSLIIAGLLAVSPRYGKWLVLAFVVFNFIVYAISLALLYPDYGFHLQPR